MTRRRNFSERRDFSELPNFPEDLIVLPGHDSERVGYRFVDVTYTTRQRFFVPWELDAIHAEHAARRAWGLELFRRPDRPDTRLASRLLMPEHAMAIFEALKEQDVSIPKNPFTNRSTRSPR